MEQTLTQSKKAQLARFISARPHLVWYVRDPAALSADSIVEHTLNYGDWDDVQALIGILGVKEAAHIFRSHMDMARKRGNYHPEVRRYFNLYFSKHAPIA